MSNINKIPVRKADYAHRRPNYPEHTGTGHSWMSFRSGFPEYVGTMVFCYSGIRQTLAEGIRSNEGQTLPVFYEPCVKERNTHKDMAGKITSMSKIKQSLLLHRQGYSLRRIAESLGGISKNTVNEYLRQIAMHGYDIDELLQLTDMELEAKFHPGNPAYTDERMDVFLSELPLYREELTHRHVTRQLVWEEYKRRHPDGYGRSQFFFHLKQNLIAEKSQTAVLTGSYRPAEKLYVDFCGDRMYYVDEDTGEIHHVETFVASMPYSDYGYAVCVESQSTENFLQALKMCLEHLGGVPKILVTDNLKASVVKADRYEPEINRVLEDMGNHYHFVSIPCQPRKPTQKSLVENHVRLVYRRVYARLRHRTFFSLQELNGAVREMMEAHNQTRMQKRPYSRQENFHANERPLLQPLPEREYEMTSYSEVTVQQNGHVQLQRSKITHYYSVPYRYIGKKALIAYTHSLVRIYIDRRCVATHVRKWQFGYTSVEEHLASNNLVQLSKSPEYYRHRAACIAGEFGRYVEWLFSAESLRGLPPEVRYRTCDMLLGLSRRYPRQDFVAACRICHRERIRSGKQFEGILRNIPLMHPDSTSRLPGISGDNRRGADYFI